MKSYNKFLVGLCVAMMVTTTISAQTVEYDDKAVAIRQVAEERGYKVSFDPETKQITLEHIEDEEIILINKEKVHIKDGISYINVDELEELIGKEDEENNNHEESIETEPNKDNETNKEDETSKDNEEIKENEEGKDSGELLTPTEVIVEALIGGDYASVIQGADEVLKAQVNELALYQAWVSLIQPYGQIQEYEEVEVVSDETYTQHVYRIKAAKGDIKLLLFMNEGNQLTGIRMLPYPLEAEKPQAMVEKELVLQTGEYSMPGILTLPSEEGKFPVVILVHGSGAQDKDVTVGGTKVFRDLAYGLAEHGIATYRYDKRTWIYNNQSVADIDAFNYQEEVIEDVISAVELIKTLPEIDTEQIYVLGHSLGAMSVPMISTQDEGVAGYIMAAGPARNLIDVVIEQVEYLAPLQGLTPYQQAMHVAKVKLDAEIVRELTHESELKELGFMGINNEMWADLNAYDHVEMAKQMTEPLLILQGGRDYQVTMEDFTLWQEALGHKEQVTFKDYPSLNHFLVAGEGVSTPEEYLYQGKVDTNLINDIVNWINKDK